MMKLAVTGGIACGKSLVTGFFHDLGARVCSADACVHKSLSRDGDAYAAVVACFGDDIVGHNGDIDRRELGQRVFADAALRKKLEQLVHGPVKRIVRDWLDIADAHVVSVVEVPLLFEAGMGNDGWDAVICVVAPVGVQEQRLLDLGFHIDDARARIAAQMPLEQKAGLADYVVINGASTGLAKEQVESIWQKLLKKNQ
jgi:dephospho-CoA kinase